MKAMVRRVTLTVEITTERGEQRTLQTFADSVRNFKGPLRDATLAVAASAELELVDENEAPYSLPPGVADLTVPVSVVAEPSSPSPAAASPSAAPATGALSPALKRPRLFGNQRSAQAPAVAPAVAKHVIHDAHRRIEPTRNSRADVVIGPRDLAPVNGGTLRVSSAHVVGQPEAPAPAPVGSRRRRESELDPLPSPLAEPQTASLPDMTAPALPRKATT